MYGNYYYDGIFFFPFSDIDCQFPDLHTLQQQAPPKEPRYAEEVISKNIGKKVIAYMTYDSSDKWRSKIFRGTLVGSGRDYLFISADNSGDKLLLFNINLNYLVIRD